MYNIDAIPPLVLGQLIEKGVNTLLFDVSGWLEEYPTGTFSISVIRPTETNVSPVASTDISVVDDILMWVIADTMTVYAGSGSVVIQLAVGDNVVKRSKRTQIIVNEGHAAPGSAPALVDDWILDAELELARVKAINPVFSLNNGHLEVDYGS